MKILTTLFLTCPIQSCRTSPSSYPLNFKSCTLEKVPVDYNPLLLRNLLPRLNLDALETIVSQLGLSAMLPQRSLLEFIREDVSTGGVKRGQQDSDDEPEQHGEDEEMEGTQTKAESPSEIEQEEALKRLHTLLVETTIQEGHLVCGNCGFEYPVKEGVGNFLLPGHLV
jgi:multifunctional methyltransferase subunit TRM112